MEIIREGALDLDIFLARPLFAHLATISEDGPRESPVWFLWEEGCVWIIANLDHDTFSLRIKKDARCAIGITDLDPARGLVHHVGFRGRAEVVPWDGARARRKLRRYLGEDEARWDPDLFTLDATKKRLALVKFTPRTAVVRDQSFRGSLAPD